MNQPVTPEDVLPDGVERATLGGAEVRKGSVAAFIANARVLETLDPNGADYARVADQLRTLTPALRAVGVFDVFAPRAAWLAELTDADSSAATP